MRPYTGQAIGLQFHLDGRGISGTGVLALELSYFTFHANELLYVMAHFMGKHIRLREFSRSAKPALQLIVKSEVDVNLLVAGAIERTSGRFRAATGRLPKVSEEYELGMAVRSARLFRQQLFPVLLRVIENEGDPLNQRFFGCISCGVGLADSR